MCRNGTKVGVAASLAFNIQGAGGLGPPQSPSPQPCRGSFPKPSKKLQLQRRGSCSKNLQSLKSLQSEPGRETHVLFFLLLKLLGRACVGVWPGTARRLQPEQGGGEGLLRGDSCCSRPSHPWLPAGPGCRGRRGPGPAACCGSRCPAHAQALEKARQKYQMSWSNICTTFPAFTKKAFYTQSTLGDELGKQRGGSPLKLTLWLCTDKASASSSLM